MSKTDLSANFGFAVLITLLFVFSLEATEDPRTRIDYWQNNYDELLPEDDPRAARAYEIFKRVLNAAGKRPGVVPRLFIVKNESAYIPLAFAIPDGGIIISKKVLDICYKDPASGDDRLAFILAHEIAHQLKDDFWHMRFFQAVELSKESGQQGKAVLDSVKAIAEMTDKVLAKELQADEYGIIYASMAGFNTSAIVREDYKVNFFEYFYAALDPGNIKGFTKDKSHPSPEQRAEIVKTRLKQVLEMVELFDFGILFYQAGNYEKAIRLFSKFLRFFPGREVYHNLACCHHQLALKYYLDWKEDEKDIVFERFKLSLTIDTETRASKITLKGTDDPEELYKKNISKAVEYYRTAISQDPSYMYSYSNLGCALLVEGEVYEAVAMLKKAVKIKSNFTFALNNLGVAFFLVENEGKAKENLIKASEVDPSYDSPIFNLGRIAYETNDKNEAKKHWMEYLKVNPISVWSDFIRNSLGIEKHGDVSEVSSERVYENIFGLEIGDYDDDMPADWGEPEKTREVSIEEEPYKILYYKNGIMTLSQDDEILLIHVPESYNSKSVKGISIGNNDKVVLSKYGNPSQILNTSKGTSWIYSSQGIAFLLREGKVVYWLLF